MKKEKKSPGGFLASAAKLFDRKHEPLLHTIEWMFILFSFFAIGMPVMYFQASENIFGDGKLTYLGARKTETAPTEAPPTEEEKQFIGETVHEPIDITSWDTYRNSYYGFEIKHPDSWANNNQYKTATEKSAKYEIIYKFRKNGEGSENVFSGYDVKIYSLKKTPKVENTNDIHLKDDAPSEMSQCNLSTQEEILGTGGLALQKISINEDNNCYKPAFFYSFTKGNYIYNIVPAIGESGERFANPEEKTSQEFPEYKEAVASLKSIPISRPVVVPAKPKITAKRPVAAKVVNGKLVCAKKNDKPRKSKKNKPGHMDMECCLDPDETPNPWCTY